MKTLLVPVASHDALPSVFETAILTARRFGSLIEGVSLRPALAEYVPVDMVGGMTWLRDEEADKVEAERAGGRLHGGSHRCRLARSDPREPVQCRAGRARLKGTEIRARHQCWSDGPLSNCRPCLGDV